MMFEDAREIPEGATLSADICVIGSGAAGITLARRLDGSANSVIVLEAGGLEQDIDTEETAFAIDHLGVPQNGTIPSRGRWYGGSTNLWFGRIATPDPIDFEQRAWVPNSGWPLTFEELKPWLRTAADVLDVPNFDKIHIGAWSPNPTIDTFIDRGGANLGVFLWADGMLMGRRGRDIIKHSKNVRLVLEATATELIANEHSSAIDLLAVSGPHGNSFTVRARTYILAAGGLENPRLLLASNRRTPAGVGNSSDNVGRYYMDHPRGEGLAGADLRGLSRPVLARLALLGEKARTPYGRAQLRVTFPEPMQRGEHLLNHSLHAHLVSDIHRSAAFFGCRRLWERLHHHSVKAESGLARDLADIIKGSPQLARFAAQKAARRERPDDLVIIDQMEQEPDPLSRVTVDHRRKDQFGLPRLQLDWRIAESTYRSQRRMHRMFKTIAEQAGIRTFWSNVLDSPDETVDLVDMKHPSGTTRMSSSPRTGVVTADCRVHGVTNLYVAGSSVFPTVGHANPTLMIVALAARLASHLGGAALGAGSTEV